MGLWPLDHGGQGVGSRWSLMERTKVPCPWRCSSKPHGHQLFDGLPHRGAAHPQGLGQVPLRHDLLPGLQLPPENQIPDLFIGLVRNPLHLNGLE